MVIEKLGYADPVLGDDVVESSLSSCETPAPMSVSPWRLLALVVLATFVLFSMTPGVIGADAPSDLIDWQNLSEGIPHQAGVVAIAVAPSNPQMVYMVLAEPNGLYRSSDSGIHWTKIIRPSEDVGILSLAVSPIEPGVVYAGTTNGVFRFDDSDATWDAGGSNLTTMAKSGYSDRPLRFVYAVLCLERMSTVLLAGCEDGAFISQGDSKWLRSESVDTPVLSLAHDDRSGADGLIFAGTVSRGVLVSRDDGWTWTSTGGSIAGETVPVVRVDGSGTVFAWAGNALFYAMWNDHLPLHWQELQLPTGWSPFSFAVASAAPEEASAPRSVRFYVGSRGKGVVVTDDAFLDTPQWQSSLGPLRWADVTCLEVHAANPDTAFLGTKFHGLYRTTDGGKTWLPASSTVGQRVVLALRQHPVDSSNWYAGTTDGVYRLGDDGWLWQPLTSEFGRLIVQDIAIDPGIPERLYAATQIGVLQSEDNGASWQRNTEDLGTINVFNITVRRSGEASTVYAGTWGNNVLRSDDGQTWASIHHGLETLSVHAFAYDERNPDILYAGTVEEIYRSDNLGDSWYPISDGMRPGITTFALAIDPNIPERLYAGTTEGVYRSDNGGLLWVAAREGLDSLTVNALAVSREVAGVMYAGTEHHGVYRSEDGGAHWNSWGLSDSSIYSIVIDDVRGDIWAGSECGVFRKSPVPME